MIVRQGQQALKHTLPHVLLLYFKPWYSIPEKCASLGGMILIMMHAYYRYRSAVHMGQDIDYCVFFFSPGEKDVNHIPRQIGT